MWYPIYLVEYGPAIDEFNHIIARDQGIYTCSELPPVMFHHAGLKHKSQKCKFDEPKYQTNITNNLVSVKLFRNQKRVIFSPRPQPRMNDNF